MKTPIRNINILLLVIALAACSSPLDYDGPQIVSPNNDWFKADKVELLVKVNEKYGSSFNNEYTWQYNYDAMDLLIDTSRGNLRFRLNVELEGEENVLQNLGSPVDLHKVWLNLDTIEVPGTIELNRRYLERHDTDPTIRPQFKTEYRHLRIPGEPKVFEEIVVLEVQKITAVSSENGSTKRIVKGVRGEIYTVLSKAYTPLDVTFKCEFSIRF